MFAVMPSPLGIWEKEGGDGVSFDHVWDNFKPVQAKERTELTPTLKIKTQKFSNLATLCHWEAGNENAEHFAVFVKV